MTRGTAATKSVMMMNLLRTRISEHLRPIEPEQEPSSPDATVSSSCPQGGYNLADLARSPCQSEEPVS